MIRICVYSDRWHYGGIESYIVTLLEKMDLSGIDITIVTSQDETDFYDNRLEILGISKYQTLKKHTNSPIIRMLSNFHAFSAYIKKKHFDIIYLNICNAVALTYAFVSRRAKIPVIIAHSHNTKIGRGPTGLLKITAHHILRRLLSDQPTDFWACSDLAAHWLFAAHVLETHDILYVKNGIDTNKFRFSKDIREMMQAKLGLKNKFVVGTVGRLNLQKNQAFLIKVFAHVAKKNPNAVLLLIGDGELRAELMQLAVNLGIERKVFFHGLSGDIASLLCAMDVFVLTSLFEGNPLAGIEAQASGLPCIFSDTITKQVKSTDLVQFVSLKETFDVWVDFILNSHAKINRSDYAATVAQAGFDINQVSEEMRQVFLRLATNKAQG